MCWVGRFHLGECAVENGRSDAVGEDRTLSTEFILERRWAR